MRSILILSALALLAGCVEQTAAPAADDLRARQEAACTATIAAHIRQPAAAVASRWLSETGGVAKVEAVDGNRRHLCDVDGRGRVLGYSHPDA
ncbi:MAG TPA: hypothetical protein GXX24_15810 [Paracoccus solventivorans]|uniref:Lipoprotein n=1 Tax=Paracoccus solventivorans TaxID=53463 RepID=A0A832QXI4_9RHOB|nr:hypothetical protein [Paracoccus solventivorans]HHW35582.1 hypothetical protein [Paracoccus solventivorans]